MSAARMDVDSSAPKLTADFLKRKETEDQSTRMPDSTQDAADSDCASGPSELETHVTSRTSKSKKSHQRGPKRMAQRARYQLKQRGVNCDGMTDDEARAAIERVHKEERDMAAARSLGVGPEIAARVQGYALKDLGTMVLDEKFHFFLESARDITPDARFKADFKDLEVVHKATIQMRPDPWGTMSPFCILCGKWDNGGHRGSVEHIKRASQEALLNNVLGKSESGRRFGATGNLGCQVLSRKSLMSYWGDGLENLVAFFRKRLADGTHIAYKRGKKASRMIGKDGIKSCGLAFLNYEVMQGKYDAGTILWHWGSIPDVVSPEEELEQIKCQRGWWPVISIRLNDDWEHEPGPNEQNANPEGGTEATSAATPATGLRITVLVIIVCVYQSLDPAPPAWPLTYTVSVLPQPAAAQGSS